MEIKINIENYLSEEEIKEICKDAIRSVIASQYRNEVETKRLISNLSYEILFDQISETINQDASELVRKNVIEILGDKSAYRYLVFRRKDCVSNTDSKACIILDEVVEGAKDVIKEKVLEVISKYDFGNSREICDRIQDCFNEIIEERIFKKS